MISQDKTTGRGEPTVTPCEKKKKEKKNLLPEIHRLMMMF